MRGVVSRGLLAALLVVAASQATAGVIAPDDPLAEFAGDGVADAVISLGSFAISPGVAGARISVTPETGRPGSDLFRGNIQIPIWIATPLEWLDVYTELGYGSIRLKADYDFENTSGEQVEVHDEFRVYSMRMGLGVDFEPVQALHIRPFVLGAFSVADLDATLSGGAVDSASMTIDERTLLADWSAKAGSIAGVVDVEYLPWVVEDLHRLDLTVRYAAMWSKSFDESSGRSSLSALRQTLTAETLWRTVLPVRLFRRRLSPNVFANATAFPGQERDDLGFSSYFGVGAGLDLYFPEPLFGSLTREFIGVRGAAVIGSGVRGWSVVASIRR